MDVLSSLGLNQKQQQAYSSLLQNGSKTASELAVELSEQRTNVYLLMDRLIELGIVERDDSHPVARFTPTNPNCLQDLLSNKQRILAQQSSRLKAALPDLIGLYHLNIAEEGMAYFEGLKGYEAALDDMANSVVEVCVFGASAISSNRPDAKEVLNRKFQKRALAKVSTRILFDKSLQDSQDVPVSLSESTRRRSLVRYWGDRPFGSGEIALYGGTIVLTSYDDKLVSLVIKNAALFSMLQTVFDTAWSQAAEPKNL